jgi:hypothetical protein
VIKTVNELLADLAEQRDTYGRGDSPLKVAIVGVPGTYDAGFAAAMEGETVQLFVSDQSDSPCGTLRVSDRGRELLALGLSRLFTAAELMALADRLKRA